MEKEETGICHIVPIIPGIRFEIREEVPVHHVLNFTRMPLKKERTFQRKFAPYWKM